MTFKKLFRDLKSISNEIETMHSDPDNYISEILNYLYINFYHNTIDSLILPAGLFRSKEVSGQ